MDNVPSSAMIAVFSIIVAAILVTALITAIGYTSDLGRNSGTVSSQMQAQTDQDDLLQYDGSTMTGSDVRNLIKKMQTDQLYIKVVQNSGSYYYGDVSLVGQVENHVPAATNVNDALAYNKSNRMAYITPDSHFELTLTRNPNSEAIVGIICEKQ